MEELQLGIGDTIQVYKANMIIPQIAENLTRSGNCVPPKVCPVCGGETKISMDNDTKTLYCTNPTCQAKQVKSFTLFVSRDAMNIEGLSEATLEKLIDRGFIKDFSDIFHVERYKEEIQKMEGFGEKSYDNLMKSIEQARTTTLPKLVYSLGIANIGLANAKVICRAFDQNPEKVMNATEEELSAISGVGDVIAKAYVDYFADEKHRELFEKLLLEVTIPKVTGSVTSKTNYLINNDVESTSSKNKKARELGVPIISEDEFVEMLK